MKLRFVPMLLAILAAVPLGAQAPPAIIQDPSSVTVSGVTPSGQVVLFGLLRRPSDHLMRFERIETRLMDDDGDGVVVWSDPSGIVPEHTVWFALDEGSGSWSVRQLEGAEDPAGFGESAVPLVGSSQWEEPGVLKELLAVRPGEGAWGLTAGDGGASDLDGSVDESVTVDLGEFWAVDDSNPEPHSLAENDLLVAIDPSSLTVSVARVTGGGM